MRLRLLVILALTLAFISLSMNVLAEARPGDGIRPPIWDPELNELNVTWSPATDCSQGCWRLIRADFLDKSESNGLHHVFTKAYDVGGAQQGGIPWRLAWPDGVEAHVTKPPPDWGDAAIWDCYLPDQGQVGGYRAWMGTTESRSDVVRGMGLPYCHHVIFQLSWQWDNGGPPTPAPTQTSAPPPTFPPGTHEHMLPMVLRARTGSSIPGSTSTPMPPAPTATPLPPSPSPTPYSATYNGAIVQTFPNCGLTQVFGIVHDRNGNPQVGRRVRLTWDGNPTPVYTTSGTYVRPETDASGWEFFIRGEPINGTWRVAMVDALGVPQSPDVLAHTVSSCNPTDVNVAKIRFRQN